LSRNAGVNRAIPPLAGHRHDTGFSCSRHSGNIPYTFQQILLKRGAVLLGQIKRGKIELDHQHSTLLKPRIQRDQVLKGAYKEKCPYHQDQGQSYLADHQRSAQAEALGRTQTAAAARLHGGCRRCPGGPQRRRKSK